MGGCWGQKTLFHWQPAPHQYYHGFWVNWFQSPKKPIITKNKAKAHGPTQGDIISSKPMVQAHNTSSHFRLMIQAHESHWGTFESHGLEGQEICSVKLQRFKVNKGNMLLSVSSPIPWTLTSQCAIDNIW